MDVVTLLRTLEAERDGLDATIKTLRARLGASRTNAKAPGAPSKPHGSVWTPARRLAMSKLMKARLATKRKAAK